MRRQGIGGITAVLVLGVMCAVLSGCGGGGGGEDGGGGGGGTSPHLMGGSVQGTSLSLVNSVSTFAGALSPGSQNGAGTTARFRTPIGITTDGTNLYVADSFNHTIRVAVISTGTVSILAGSAGSPGFTDATGSAARFNQPQGITISTDGTKLYVADTNNNVIRQVVIATGAVTTVAGDLNGTPGLTDGNGPAARFSSPAGITADGTYLYVADTYNHAIRRILILSGYVETIAGDYPNGSSGFQDANGTSARFNVPQGITTDNTYLFVTEAFNYRIRKINKSLPYGVSTLAGSGTQGANDGTGASAEFGNPYGITSDGTNLYVADVDSNTIRKVTSGGVVTTVAGDASAGAGYNDATGTSARFNSPNDVTTDGTNLYVSDSLNNMIRTIR